MMTWKPIDFRGIVSLKSSIIENLHRYLEEKESQASNQIVQAIKGEDSKQAWLIPPTVPVNLKLSEAIEINSKKLRQLLVSKQSVPDNSKEVEETFDQVLWNYVESLESSVTELFQQIDQMGIEEWRPNLLHVLDEIKVMLIYRIDDLIWSIRRLEEQLKEYRQLCRSKKGWKKWEKILDKDLKVNLDNTRKYLTDRYHAFADHFNAYHNLNTEVYKETQKLESFHVLSVLEHDAKLKYFRLVQLLRLWDKNKEKKQLAQEDVIYAIRSLVSYDRISAVFKDYYNMLKLVLFERSRNLKSNPQELFIDSIGKNILLEVVSGFREENRSLEWVVEKYRQFILETDPNPKVRQSWHLARWMNKEETPQSRHLHNQLYDLEELHVLFDELKEGIEKGPVKEGEKNLSEDMIRIQKWLHEMGQPLISKPSMRLLSERVVRGLHALDELGSFNQYVSDFVGESLSKAMRNDWKYQTLLDVPEFYDVYTIHQGLSYVSEDRPHTARLNKFKRLLQQIDEWMKKKTYPKHIHEIEVDMSDIKGYLQDFLGQVQRFSREHEGSESRESKEQVREYYRQLLEYRYLFGAFFHELHEDDIEERNIRNHFLFVDQYFESVDNKLREMK